MKGRAVAGTALALTLALCAVVPVVSGFSRTGAAFPVVSGFSRTGESQRGRGASGEKPKSEIVQTVGCAEQKGAPSGEAGSWWLTRAAEPRTATPGIFNSTQVETARSAPLGGGVFQLVGVADFLDTEGLLRSGQRQEFTTPGNANATGQLRQGRRILVKGMLIASTDPKRINLLSVIALSDTCG